MPWASLKALVQKRGRGGHLSIYATLGREQINGMRECPIYFKDIGIVQI